MQPKEEIPIIKSTYDLFTVIFGLNKHVSKSARYTIWQRCENKSLDLLNGLLSAGYKPQSERRAALIEASITLDMLKMLIRLSKDTNVISAKAYLLIQSRLDQIGRMLGGWIKSVPTPQSKDIT